MVSSLRFMWRSHSALGPFQCFMLSLSRAAVTRLNVKVLRLMMRKMLCRRRLKTAKFFYNNGSNAVKKTRCIECFLPNLAYFQMWNCFWFSWPMVPRCNSHVWWKQHSTWSVSSLMSQWRNNPQMWASWWYSCWATSAPEVERVVH